MPFNEECKNKAILQAQQLLAFPWKNFHNVTEECRNLILKMFTYDFVKRPEIQIVVRDPWFEIEKPVVPKFTPRPKTRASMIKGGVSDISGGDAGDQYTVRPSLSVESGVQTSPRMPPRQSFAGYFSQKPRLKTHPADSSYYRQQYQPQQQPQPRHHSSGVDDGDRGSSASSRAGYRYGATVNRTNDGRMASGSGGGQGMNAGASGGRTSSRAGNSERPSSRAINGDRPPSRAGNGERASIGSGGNGRDGYGNIVSERAASAVSGSQRMMRAMAKTPSPLAEPPRPKRIWLNGGTTFDQSCHLNSNNNNSNLHNGSAHDDLGHWPYSPRGPAEAPIGFFPHTASQLRHRCLSSARAGGSDVVDQRRLSSEVE